MNYRNSIEFVQSLSSQYRGAPLMLFADATPVPPVDGATPPAEPPPEGEPPAEGTPQGGEPPEGAEDDPLTAPNPYKEGEPNHDAFERQRAKFKQKLEKEKEAARKEGETSALLGKLDEVLKNTAPKPDPSAPPAPEPPKATDADVEIVKDALRKVGLDPEKLAHERRVQELNAALDQLKKTYPDVEINGEELAKIANENGISKMGGSYFTILELALLHKNKAALTGAPKPPAAPTPTTTPKKEPVPISGSSTKATPAPEDKPKGKEGWMSRIKSKYGA